MACLSADLERIIEGMNTRLPDNGFTDQVVNEILIGVQDGLTRFSGPSRVAVIYRLGADGEYCISDPGGLLRGHETKIRAAFFDDRDRPVCSHHYLSDKPYSHIDRVDDLDLDGIISIGGQSGPVPYQMWFTDHHPEIISTGPTQRWLEHAALRFSHDIANEQELYSGISGRFLREFATHAVHGHIASELERFSPCQRHDEFSIYSILDGILAISRTREESKSPHGVLSFILPENVESVDFMARFDESEQPQLDNHKHVRKLLQAVQKFRNRLISDGTRILGIARGRLDHFHISADFQGLYGFLRVNDQAVCSFADGTYSSATHQARLFQVEEALLDYDLDSSVRSSLFHIVSSIVHYGETENFGCSVVVDLNERITRIAGQNLQQPLDLERSNLLDLACDLARVDGALQICSDRKLHRFACLFDGPAIARENRARGARYNSALRFTARNPDTVIVVVSADRPVSVIRNGSEYMNMGSAPKYSGGWKPQLLQNWLKLGA